MDFKGLQINHRSTLKQLHSEEEFPINEINKKGVLLADINHKY